MARSSAQQLSDLLARPIAHRGLHACGRPGPVENSIGAARAAIARGYGIECDVLLSRDGDAMVFHDDTLARLTGQPGRLADHDAAALSRLTLGTGPDHIPRLAAFLAAIDGAVPVVIEIKSIGDGDMRLAERTVAILSGYEGAAAIESFDARVVGHCRSLRTGRPIGLVGPAEDGPDQIDDAWDFLSWSIDDLARIATRYPHIPRSSWTVRTPAQADHAALCGAQIVFEAFDPRVKDQ